MITEKDIPWGFQANQADDAFEKAVECGIAAERIKREVRTRLAVEDHGACVAPPLATVRERLSRPRLPLRYRIDGWMPEGARLLLAAPHKSGKTTLRNELTRSLADGDPFLGVAAITPFDGTIGVIDIEMSERQTDVWFEDLRIVNDDRIVLVSLRGAAASFNILDAAVRAGWASRLQAHRVKFLILDCLRPVLDALCLDEHRDAGRLLVAFDALLAEADIPEGILVHHTGHGQERARGDSRLLDWPDVNVVIVRKDDDPNSQRFIRAFGRDVDVPEQALAFDVATRRLTLEGGSRKDAKHVDVLEAVLSALDDSTDAMSGRAIKTALGDTSHGKDAIDAALGFGRKHGYLSVSNGRHGAILYRRGSTPLASGSVRVVSAGQSRTSVRVSETPLGVGHRTHGLHDRPATSSVRPDTRTQEAADGDHI